jgi:hypothetical protein
MAFMEKFYQTTLDSLIDSKNDVRRNSTETAESILCSVLFDTMGLKICVFGSVFGSKQT